MQGSLHGVGLRKSHLCQTHDLQGGHGIAVAALLSTDAYLAQGQLAEANRAATEAIMCFCQVRHRRGQAAVLNRMARISLASGDADGAQEKAGQSLPMYQELGDRQGEASVLQTLVRICVLQRSSKDALRIGAEAGQLFCSIDDKHGFTAIGNRTYIRSN